MRYALFVVALGRAAHVAVAQSSSHPDPTDATATVPPFKQESAFADYQPFREQKIAPWKQILDEVVGVPGAGGHAGHRATAAAAGESKEALPTTGGHEGHETMAKTEPQPSSLTKNLPTGMGATIAATGIVQSIDKANGKVKLIHDPIAVLGWPKMTMFFRLKDAALADQVKEGDAVQFYLEKATSGYVISGFKKAMPDNDMRDMGKGDKQ